jgi:hypothetical protein
MENRITEVNRENLLEKLKANRLKHIKDYEEAMAGYKSVLLSKIESAFAEAKQDIEDKYNRVKAKVASFTDADIAMQRDAIVLVDSIAVEMKVPRSYAAEYDAAIDMVSWDVNETLKLTNAEFTCFVRDEWDWKGSFDSVSMFYKAAVGAGR